MSSDESTCAITDSEAAFAVGVVYCFITGFMMLITHCCRKKNADDKYAKDRFAYAEYMGECLGSALFSTQICRRFGFGIPLLVLDVNTLYLLTPPLPPREGRYPLFSFLLTGGLLVICCGMAVFTPCLELKSFNIDKNTQNYIKVRYSIKLLGRPLGRPRHLERRK